MAYTRIGSQPRPVAISVIAAFLFAATAIAAFVGCTLLFPGRLLDWLAQFNKPGMASFRAIGRWSGIFLIALGCGTFSAAIGMLRGRNWAWWFAVVLFIVDGTGDLASFLVTGDWLRSASGAIISGIFLFTLSRPRVRNYFNADTDARAGS